jgi:4,5-dihydroxyphthalate decarboxylase
MGGGEPQTLEALVQYLYEQKIIERTVSVDELLVPVRKNNFRIG